jgi:hypothetical protein
MANNILNSANSLDRWKAAMAVCGFNDITILYIGSHGVFSITDFVGIPYSQMDLFIDNINKPSLFPLPAMLSHSSIVKLKAFRAYLGYKSLMDMP